MASYATHNTTSPHTTPPQPTQQHCAVSNCIRTTQQYYTLTQKQITVATTCFPAIGIQQQIHKGDVLCQYHYSMLSSYASDIAIHIGADTTQFQQQWNNKSNENDLLYNNEPTSAATTSAQSSVQSYQCDNNDMWPVAESHNSNDTVVSESPVSVTTQLQRTLARHALLYSKLDKSMISTGWLFVMALIIIYGCYTIF